MPRSAIAAGLADVVAPVAELPGRIVSYTQHAPLRGRSAPLLADGELSAMEKVAIVLRARTGHDFSLYKKSTVLRRIERRMGIHQIDRIATHVTYLQKNPQEVELLFRELLIGVTSFFRETAARDKLRDEALPPLLAGRAPRSVVRAWSVGCSTGEEAFSLAIVLREAIEKVAPRAGLTVQVFATDLDADGITRARAGLFPHGIVSDVSAERLKRFFVQEDGGSFRIGKEVREMVTFATQNVLMDPPFTKLEVLVCRNLLIYLGPELQKRLLPVAPLSEALGDAEEAVLAVREPGPCALGAANPSPHAATLTLEMIPPGGRTPETLALQVPAHGAAFVWRNVPAGTSARFRTGSGSAGVVPFVVARSLDRF